LRSAVVAAVVTAAARVHPAVHKRLYCGMLGMMMSSR
jgi:hypothetical protein